MKKIIIGLFFAFLSLTFCTTNIMVKLEHSELEAEAQILKENNSKGYCSLEIEGYKKIYIAINDWEINKKIYSLLLPEKNTTSPTTEHIN